MAVQKRYRYFTAKRIWRYIDVLTNIIQSYNDTHHRSIGMAPMEVTADNEDVVRERLYPPKQKTLRWKFNVGDKVCISMQRRSFKKGYVGNWSEELFVVGTRLPYLPVTYKLKDLAGDDMKKNVLHRQASVRHETRRHTVRRETYSENAEESSGVISAKHWGV